MEDKRQQKVKFPIRVKLGLIFSTLIVIVLCVTTYMVSTLVRNDERIKAEETNHTINGRTAVVVQTKLEAVENASKSYLEVLSLSSQKSWSALFDAFCAENPDTVFLWSPAAGAQVSSSFAQNHANTDTLIGNWLSENKTEAMLEVLSSQTESIYNVSSLFNSPVLCIAFPYGLEGEEICLAGFSANDLVETMTTGSYNTSFLLDESGNVLIHSDIDKAINGENFSVLTVVQEAFNGGTQNVQLLGADENDENCFFAFYKLDAYGIYAVTKESEALVFETINRTTYRIILISIAAWLLSIILIRYFSKTITHPVETLVGASQDIQEGNFILNIKPKSKDELGLLTESFVKMGKGLAERERLKTTFSKFTNKTIAERAMNGELNLGGENRKATIFFSDIRSFTAISEKLKPQEVVEFLNDYMTRMVECVNKTGGVVDKYIGDAIMCVWGAPESAGSPAGDALCCVMSALMMRSALIRFNQSRDGSDKQPILHIGCGINTGDVIAGQIGSSERMEYTVIGDAVNLASRTEALNKPFHTDILITENTYKLIKKYVIVEEMPSVHVKGKSEPVKIFAVVNRIGAPGPKTMAEVRKLLKVDAPDLSGVNTDEEEKKYKIN
ncbi:MAG: HAMP domain-containing protein [Treponema sp.]|nr:HAMP domain-containing protein [Candidatus Treponema caballi]